MPNVIVVGAGNAGLCAALAAAEQGAAVTLVERAPRAERGGNSASPPARCASPTTASTTCAG